MAFSSLARRTLVPRSFVRNSSSKSKFEHMPAEEAEKTGRMWKNVFFFGAIPVILLGHLNVYLKEKEEEHEERPPYVAYDCLYVRTKKYPWGDGTRTFFHNPRHNPLPGIGYEQD